MATGSLLREIEKTLRRHYKVLNMTHWGDRKHTIIGLCVQEEHYLHPLSRGKQEFERDLKKLTIELALLSEKQKESLLVRLTKYFQRKTR